MDERMTICNMVVEAGGKNGVIAPDQTTYDYVRARTQEDFEPVFTDAGAGFCDDYRCAAAAAWRRSVGPAAAQRVRLARRAAFSTGATPPFPVCKVGRLQAGATRRGAAQPRQPQARARMPRREDRPRLHRQLHGCAARCPCTALPEQTGGSAAPPWCCSCWPALKLTC